MKFLISRREGFDSNRPSCEGARLETYTRVEVRTLETFEAFDAKFGEREGAWLSKGENHRALDQEGHIARDWPGDASGWFLDIDSLDALMAFIDRYGPIAIGWDWANRTVREIEIV